MNRGRVFHNWILDGGNLGDDKLAITILVFPPQRNPLLRRMALTLRKDKRGESAKENSGIFSGSLRGGRNQGFWTQKSAKRSKRASDPLVYLYIPHDGVPPFTLSRSPPSRLLTPVELFSPRMTASVAGWPSWPPAPRRTHQRGRLTSTRRSGQPHTSRADPKWGRATGHPFRSAPPLRALAGAATAILTKNKERPHALRRVDPSCQVPPRTIL